MDAAAVAEKVFCLFERYGNVDYIGEEVTQIQHAVQCAMLAEQEDGRAFVILGALLHDIGHLQGQDLQAAHMETDGIMLGVEHHDKVGEAFLRNLGVPEEVTDYVTGHVQAKRYLTFKDPAYYRNLSDASKMTLVHQGGPMSASEAEAFQRNPRLESILSMRTWDERAKIKGLPLKPLSDYKAMFISYLNQQS